MSVPSVAGPAYPKDLFGNEVNIHKQFLPIINPINQSSPDTNIWDIPYTINQLSYLVHSHYRYYGKFPSVVAGQLLDQFPPPSADHYVLDHFCGSGTTLVEARLRGIHSFGLDISWLACLASNVKANPVDTDKVKSEFSRVCTRFLQTAFRHTAPEDQFTTKWFQKDVSRDLAALSDIIHELPESPEKDFLLVAYLGIIRRVSRAFDGEVRPHINKEKKQRDVLSAFSKKIRDMCSDHDDYMGLIDSETRSRCYVGSNLELPNRFKDGKCYFVISHPPYLNSFNYTPVYSLEFYWGARFEKNYADGNKTLHRNELTAHPASEKVTKAYFNHLEQCYKETYRIQRPGGYLAIVIGDCTRNGEIIPVIDNTVEILKDIGYKPLQFNYRTTHYGLGKYAYKHRADYHGNASKRDGILVFRR